MASIVPSTAAQVTDPDGCPHMGTRFVRAHAEVNSAVSCTSATIRVNGITVTTSNSQPGACPTVVTYYPAHYQAGETKRGFRLGSRHRLPITVFRHECVGSYLLFLYLGDSCEYSGRFQSGFLDSWEEQLCNEKPQVVIDG